MRDVFKVSALGPRGPGLSADQEAALDNAVATVKRQDMGFPVIIRDTQGRGLAAFEADGNLLRNTRREAIRHLAGAAAYTGMMLDNAGWAAEAYRGDGSAVPVGGQLHRIIAQVLHVILYGQSGALGVESLPLQPALANSRVLMYAGGVRPWNSTAPTPGTPDYSSLATLIEEDDSGQGGTLHAGETPASGWAMGFIAGLSARFGLTLSDLNAYLLLSAAGQGSTPATFLRRDQGYAYPRLVEQEKAGFARAQDLGRSYATQVMHLDHGEADTDLATDPAIYKALLRRIINDAERDAMTANSRYMPMVMTMTQMSSWNVIDAGTYPDIALGQAEFAKEWPFAVMAAPSYMHDFVQGTAGLGLHKDGWSSRLSGYYAGRAYALSLQMDEGGLWFDPARKFRPLAMKAARRQGPRLVEVEFDVPVAPLVFDTGRVADPGDYGFAISRPGSGVIGIDTPTIVNRTRVLIKADADLKPGDLLTYGSTETPDGSTKRTGRTYGPRGNLADSASDMFDPSGVNFRARNYCLHGRLSIL